MSEPLDFASEAWSPEQARALDDLCQRFEKAWKAGAGAPPLLEEYLGELPKPWRPALLRELLLLDLDYRWLKGERPTADEYQDRFPDYLPAVRAAFAKFVPPSSEDVPRATARPGPANETAPVTGLDGDRTDVGEPTPAPPEAPATTAGSPVVDGRQVPGYEILGKLGEGGMGVVYKALHLPLNRVVALKMIRPDVRGDPEYLSRFRREAETVARLQHANIVQIYEISEHDGLPYFSLEFVEGGSLDRKIRGAPQPGRPAAELVATLARAMAAVHALGITHRDLKPANVLLLADGTPKITDFGLAKQLDRRTLQTDAGAILGTPNYMAPEQASGRGEEVGPLADVYALGAILYEMLTGRPPFLGENAFHTLAQVCTHDPVSPRRLQPTVPPDLEKICLKCLEKEPRRRYAGAQDLADDLRRFRNDEPVRARLITPVGRALKWARRHRAAAVAVVASALAVLGGVSGVVFYSLYQAQQTAQQLAALHKKVEARQTAVAFWKQGRDARAAAQLGDAKQLRTARDSFVQALAALDAEPGADTGEYAAIKKDRDEVDQALTAQASRRDLKDRRDRFEQFYRDVSFHEISYTESLQDADRAAIRRAAPAALKEFGLSAADTPAEAASRLEAYRPAADGPRELDEIAADCYRMLLTWAEAEAPPGTNDEAGARRALHLLDLAAALAEAYHLPTPQAYHLRRAGYLELTDKHAEADTERERAAGMKPETALDLFLAARESYRQGKPDQAAATCEQVLRLQPDHFWAQYLEARCHVSTKHWGEARAELTSCLSRHDFFLGRLLRATAETVLNEPENAEADFARALEQAPDDLARWLVLIDRGALWRQRQRWDEAIADLRQAIALRPEAPEAYVNLAQAYAGREDWDSAVVTLGKALDLRPRDAAELYHTRAQFNADRAAARRDFEQAIAHEPKGSTSELLVSSYVELGHLQNQDRDFEQALASLDAALGVRPDYAAAHLQRSKALLALKRDREAGEALDRYLRCGGTRTEEVYLARGLIHDELREYEAAVDCYGQALVLRPDARTLLDRGRAYLKLDAARLALADFRAALRLKPASADALCYRARAQVRLGQVPAAVADVQAALAKGPREPRLLVNAACVYALAVGWLEAHPAASSSAGSAYSYQEQALALLRAALEGVPAAKRKDFWPGTIQNEPDLVPISRSTGFLELARSYGR
jgi:tetratricopeptide (TPR) repeat protein